MEYGGNGKFGFPKKKFYGNKSKTSGPLVNKYGIGLRSRMGLDRMRRYDFVGNEEWLALAAAISTRELREILMLIKMTSAQNEMLG
jgi:hypothetical protein